MEMKNPFVSVVIPVYNGSDYLREAIDSVLNQTYQNYEIIVVDDGSTDDTWEIILSYNEKIKGIHKDNGGVASALNAGINVMSGDFFAWLSHDDIWDPDKLSKQVAFHKENPDIPASYTDFSHIDTSGRFIQFFKVPWYPREVALRKILGAAYINGSSIFIHKNCFEMIGNFDENLKYTQDTHMWLRILRTYEIGHIPFNIVTNRIHEKQGSRNIQLCTDEAKIMFNAFYNSIPAIELFPNQSENTSSSALEIMKLEWYGKTVAQKRKWFDVADMYFNTILEYDDSLVFKVFFLKMYKYLLWHYNLINIIMKNFIRILYK
ncbi:MAG: glycosyltransferase [Methanospirillaceae archaeon]|nr:glycosyltransferase [Methanospirillaceae archaeon]